MTFASSVHFESHSGPLANYPPFPARLLVQSTYNGSQASSGLSSSASASVKRRVRPIAVMPPPGFENQSMVGNGSQMGSVELKQMASGYVPSSSGASMLPSAMSSSQSNWMGQQTGSYINHVKNRAISGALAGDWSVGRSIPDIPSFLLTHMLLHFDSSSPSTLMMLNNSQDLATFCLANNIHSNINSPTFDDDPSRAELMADRLKGPLFGPSATYNAAVPNVSSSFATEDTPNKSAKRRLAPTQITADNLFNKQFVPVVTQPIPAHTYRAQQQLQQQEVRSAFQRTPRAPKDVRKSGSIVGAETANAKELGVFPNAQANVEPTPATVSAEVMEFSDIHSGSEADRSRIPPPQPSSPRRRLSQRLKQLAIGKNTPEYRNYIALVPVDCRKRGDAVTPSPEQDISKRNWEGQVRKWRRMLHSYDLPSQYDDVYVTEQVEQENEIDDEDDDDEEISKDCKNVETAVEIHQPSPQVAVKETPSILVGQN